MKLHGNGSNNSPRIVVAAGGTGGHVFPGIAVAEELRKRGCTILFLGTNSGIEAKEVPRAGFGIETINTLKIKGMSTAGRLRALFYAPSALSAALAKIRKFKPHVVVGVGGYVSGPAVLAAGLSKIPSILLEQNAIPGVTNRILSRTAKCSVVAFDEALKYLPRSINLGNPVRAEIVERLMLPRLTRVLRPKPVLLVLGGSQGARALNDSMVKICPILRDMGLRILHGTGEADYEWVKDSYTRWGVEAELFPFIEDMASAYENCDFVLCRAGATTIAELTLAGKPALLVPFPYAADDHQTANACSLADRGAAVCIPQKELTSDRLMAEIRKILFGGDLRGRMSKEMKKLARPDAASRVADLILSRGGCS